MGALTRTRGQGRLLPWWIDTQDPEAARGNRMIRTVDPNFVVGRNGRTGRFEIWGPSLSAGGWVQLQEVRADDGTPFLGTVPWEQVVRVMLAARESAETAVDRVYEHNRRLDASRRAAQRNEFREKTHYFAKAVGREFHGDGRWNAADVSKGFHLADQGRTRPAREHVGGILVARDIGGKDKGRPCSSR